jgi:hypothetical protein
VLILAFSVVFTARSADFTTDQFIIQADQAYDRIMPDLTACGARRQ